MTHQLTLYSYWRSSAAYRVRIVLNLKGLEFETVPVHLVKEGGEQRKAPYTEFNPNQLVPCLVDGDFTLNQSMAIIDYLEHICPEPALLTGDAKQQATIKAFAQDIACDIHPLNNLRVLQHLTSQFKGGDQSTAQWYRHWISEGFKALEARALHTAGNYCFGDNITLADVVLIPQVYNAYRYQLNMAEYPTLDGIYKTCCEIPAFINAAPENQPDAV